MVRPLALVTLLLLSGPAPAENQTLAGNNEKRSYRLGAGDTLNVLGNRCDIRIEGSSGTVNVQGNHNTILVDGTIQQVNLNGNHNDAVVIVVTGRPGPEVVQVGRDNSVVHRPR